MLCKENQLNQTYISFKMEIIDYGIGIHKSQINKLFLNFSKLEDPEKVNNQGTGLGLSLCK